MGLNIVKIISEQSLDEQIREARARQRPWWEETTPDNSGNESETPEDDENDIETIRSIYPSFGKKKNQK